MIVSSKAIFYIIIIIYKENYLLYNDISVFYSIPLSINKVFCQLKFSILRQVYHLNVYVFTTAFYEYGNFLPFLV